MKINIAINEIAWSKITFDYLTLKGIAKNNKK